MQYYKLFVHNQDENDTEPFFYSSKKGEFWHYAYV